MPGLPSSGVLKIWLYAIASVLLGSWAAPLLYNAGKALAEVSESKNTNSPLEWLAAVCQRTEFPEFFVASLLIAGGVLFLPFYDWLKCGRGTIFARNPQATPGDIGSRRSVGGSQAWRQGAMGFLIVTVLFLFLAGVLFLTGALQWKGPANPVFSFVWKGFATALGLAILQEKLFRGIALGTFLRAMRPEAAIAMTAVLFSLVHFLNPPPGLDVVDPDASGVGFELLRALFVSFFHPRIFLISFLPLLALGGVLAFARWATASPGLSTGLHAGWIFSHILIDGFTIVRGKSIFWGSGDASLRQGIVPLGCILLIAFLVSKLTAPRHVNDATN
ncbi:CPBP family intramembrane metalloprotease [Luteolibacter yonseiensis]|uniref:CPBP family intramembrane metalloprotease n=1 Tax=Luteolibacter yonseiensis TaxID=1144680 RepID=A0A934QXF3_9BACT|nr:CPBP family intramembrane glutamic endopeptidase [Luteolibacter yonseiensis]MBK1814503.1 CPBP family intramembrane metalloprotease [Luteolibacter yonseiensis]